MVKETTKTDAVATVKAKALQDFYIERKFFAEGTIAEFTAEQVGRLSDLLTTDLETKTLKELKAMEKALKDKQIRKAVVTK